jgi:hypothetical protein
MIKQFSVFLENRPGRLANLVDLLSKNGIKIMAMGIAEAGNYGIVRCVLDNDEKALSILKDANTAVNIVDVLILELGDIEVVVKVLEKVGVNIDYAYTMNGGKIVVKVNDEEKAIRVLKESKLKVLAKT